MRPFPRPAARAAALLFPLVLAAAGTAAGQTAFSLKSVGQPLADDDARMIARGGWGMAVTDSMHPGFKNLASLSAIKHVALSFTAIGESADNRDQRGDRQTSRVLTPNVRLALPVVKERLAFTTGFQIYRSSQFSVAIEDTVFGSAWGDSVVQGDYRFVREGSKFRVPLGLAWRPVPWLRVSGALNLENGSLREELSQAYNSPWRPGNFAGDRIPFYLADIREERHEFNGTSATLGFIFAPFRWLQAGGSWTPAHDLDVERRLSLFGVTQQVQEGYTLHDPDEYMAGVQAGIGRWRAGGDVRYQDLGEFRGWGPWQGDLTEEVSWAAGLERRQAHIRRGGYRNLPLRLGYTRRQWGYLVGDGKVVEEAWSLGTGFPFRGNMGQLDIALSRGKIGDMDRNRMETKYWRLTVSVVGLERWW